MREHRTRRFLVRHWAASAALMWAACGPVAGAAADAPPTADFFRASQLGEPLLSPSGDLMAVTIANQAGRKQLGVIDLRSLEKSHVVAAFEDADIGTFEWVNEHRLVYTARETDEAYANQHGGGLYAVDVDGKNMHALVGRTWNFVRERSIAADRVLSPNHWLQSVLRDGSDDVLVVRGDREDLHNPHLTLLRLNTMTAGTTSMSLGAPPGVQQWITDPAGVPRALVSLVGPELKTYRRDAATGRWELVYQDDNGYVGARLSAIDVDARGKLYVTASRADAGRTSALFRYDLATATLEAEPLLAVDGFDFNGSLVFDADGAKLLGVHYESDGPGSVWFDPVLQAHQERIDKLLPATANRIDCRRCGSDGLLLVQSSSDRQPPVYWLFDAKLGTLQSLGASHPWIDPKAMGTRDFVRLTARDGMSIPAYVTRPPKRLGAGPWPTVVLVHGGPWVRGGHWGWAADAQFLATRGYLVVEPEFRGSTGYGQKLYTAGFKQWGLAMQDDVADAAKWAVAQGLADRSRIAIMGASYGGYATLMGLIRNPDVYRCGVEWVGVTDIDLMYSITWSDASVDYQAYGMPELIGDREKDAAQFEATSPLKQAARVTQPLLMAYGGEDRRVPIKHGQAFRDAVMKTNKQVEWVEYADEGHGFYLLKNRVDFWSRVERFLDRNLRSAGTAAASTAEVTR